MFDIQRLKQTKLVVNETLVASDFDGEIGRQAGGTQRPTIGRFGWWVGRSCCREALSAMEEGRRLWRRREEVVRPLCSGSSYTPALISRSFSSKRTAARCLSAITNIPC